MQNLYETVTCIAYYNVRFLLPCLSEDSTTRFGTHYYSINYLHSTSLGYVQRLGYRPKNL